MTYESYMLLCYIGAGLCVLMFIISVILFFAFKIELIITCSKKNNSGSIIPATTKSATSLNTENRNTDDTTDIPDISFDIPGFSIEQAIMIINSDEKIDQDI